MTAAMHGSGGVRPGGVRGLLVLFADAFVRLRTTPRLRVSLLAWEIFGLIFTEGYCLLLAALHGDGHVWMAGAGAVWWAFVSLFMVGGAPLLVRPDGVTVDYYGVPNGLSALRAWACVPLLMSAYVALPGDLNLILWCSVGATTAMFDYVDGLIARRVGPITEMGKAFDPAMDALFFSLAAVGATSSAIGIMPPWLAGVVLFRYIGPLLATPVVFLMHRRPELVHTAWGRRNTAIIGAVFFVLMWFRIFNGPVGAAAIIVAVPTVLPSMLLHFASLWQRARSAPVVP